MPPMLKQSLEAVALHRYKPFANSPRTLAPAEEVLGTAFPKIICSMPEFQLVADVLPKRHRSSGNISRSLETRCSHLFVHVRSNILLLRGRRCIVFPTDPPRLDVAGFHLTRMDVVLASPAVKLASGTMDWTQLSIAVLSLGLSLRSQSLVLLQMSFAC